MPSSCAKQRIGTLRAVLEHLPWCRTLGSLPLLPDVLLSSASGRNRPSGSTQFALDLFLPPSSYNYTLHLFRPRSLTLYCMGILTSNATILHLSCSKQRHYSGLYANTIHIQAILVLVASHYCHLSQPTYPDKNVCSYRRAASLELIGFSQQHSRPGPLSSGCRAILLQRFKRDPVPNE